MDNAMSLNAFQEDKRYSMTLNEFIFEGNNPKVLFGQNISDGI